MTKGRSPNYPQLTLEEALQRIRPLYEATHTYPTDKQVIAENLGYGGLHGKSLTLIGALRRYNLLEAEGEGMRVSEDAVTLLELPKGDPQHVSALDRAAFAPRLFAQMHADFGTNLPNDVTLRHYLIKQGFLPKAADEVIRVYRANLELVLGENDAYNERMSQPDPRSTATQFVSPPSIPSAERFGMPSVTSDEGVRFHISSNQILASFSGTVTQEIIQKLIKHLEIYQDDFPTKAALEGTTGATEPES
ncbi:MAG TPA: hypothetical protein VEW46_18590 [Pyrinomonadaceae bacterium]|nr:hypothetical protein [Pyrinomonadaceae bacterium]